MDVKWVTARNGDGEIISYNTITGETRHDSQDVIPRESDLKQCDVAQDSTYEPLVIHVQNNHLSIHTNYEETALDSECHDQNNNDSVNETNLACYMCDVCSRIFMSSVAMETHKLMHHCNTQTTEETDHIIPRQDNLFLSGSNFHNLDGTQSNNRNQKNHHIEDNCQNYNQNYSQNGHNNQIQNHNGQLKQDNIKVNHSIQNSQHNQNLSGNSHHNQNHSAYDHHSGDLFQNGNHNQDHIMDNLHQTYHHQDHSNDKTMPVRQDHSVKCDTCDKFFVDSTVLACHMRMHFPSSRSMHKKKKSCEPTNIPVSKCKNTNTTKPASKGKKRQNSNVQVVTQESEKNNSKQTKPTTSRAKKKKTEGTSNSVVTHQINSGTVEETNSVSSKGKKRKITGATSDATEGPKRKNLRASSKTTQQSSKKKCGTIGNTATNQEQMLEASAHVEIPPKRGRRSNKVTPAVPKQIVKRKYKKRTTAIKSQNAEQTLEVMDEFKKMNQTTEISNAASISSNPEANFAEQKTGQTPEGTDNLTNGSNKSETDNNEASLFLNQGTDSSDSKDESIVLPTNKLQCQFCQKTFAHSGSLSNHLRRHTDDRRFNCSYCGKEFLFNGDLRKHIRSHTNERPYKCTMCEKAFTLAGNLSKHMDTHSDNKPFECQHCSKTFRRAAHLKMHMTTHSDDRPFHCKLCDKRFTRAYGLTAHLRTHTGEKSFQCKQCLKTFYFNSDLIKHKRSHTKEKPYACDQCDKAYAQPGALKIHMRGHTGDKPFKCTDCTKSFSNTSALSIHKRIHTDCKPFKCSQCEKAFSQKWNLLNHERTHTGERPFKCDVCLFAFKDPSSLARHKMIHLGVRPYACELCGKCFKRNSHKKKHMESVHNIEEDDELFYGDDTE